MIETRISKISSGEKEFEKAKPAYETREEYSNAGISKSRKVFPKLLCAVFLQASWAHLFFEAEIHVGVENRYF